MSDKFPIYSLPCLSRLPPLSITLPSSAETAQQPEPSPPVTENQPAKDVSSFSSSASSPWDSPENPFQAPKPAPARAQSAPITQPTEPLDPVRSPPASSPPKSVDAFSSVSWSQSQWIAFSDNFAPPRRQGSGPSLKDAHRPHAGASRSSRFLSDESADAYCKAAASREDLGFTDVFSGMANGATTAAPASKVFNGNTNGCWRRVSCLQFGVVLFYLFVLICIVIAVVF